MSLIYKVSNVVPKLILACILVLAFAPLTVFANTPTEESKLTYTVTTSDINKLCSRIGTGDVGTEFQVKLKAQAETQDVKVFYCDGNGLIFNKTAFDNGTEKSRKQVMTNFVEALRSSGIEEQEQQHIIDQLNAKDTDISRILIPIVMDKTSADLYTALKWLTPFLPIIRVLFGIGAIVISILLIGSTIVDLAFIGLPIMRESMENNANGKSGKISFVSSDAVSVVRETASSADSSGGYTNAYLLYFKRRALTYIILSICLLYLVLGELSGLIGWLLSLGDGIVGGS